MSTDPVCGMEVYESEAPATAEYLGAVYYFCSNTCQGAFQDNPEAYLGDRAVGDRAA